MSEKPLQLPPDRYDRLLRRRPLTEEELQAIEQRYARHESHHEDIPAMLAEIRRLRIVADVAKALADRVIEIHNQSTQP